MGNVSANWRESESAGEITLDSMREQDEGRQPDSNSVRMSQYGKFLRGNDIFRKFCSSTLPSRHGFLGAESLALFRVRGFLVGTSFLGFPRCGILLLRPSLNAPERIY